jgi:outer membrane protein assembly factor BamD
MRLFSDLQARRRLDRATASVVLGLLVALGSASCAGDEKRATTALDYTENAKRDYDRAVEALNDKNWEIVEELFNDVRKNYSYSRYARLAELRIADAHYHQEKLAEAISAYRAFVHDYPNDPEVPYARFRIAKAEYESVSQTVFLPPLEERDLASVNDALGTIRGFLEDFPNSEHAEELRYMLEVVLGLLARHELYVARYYLAQDRFDAAAARADHAIKTFPTSGLEPEALLLLSEIRLKQRRPKDAEALLIRLLTEHPDSPFSVPARNYLARLGSPEPVGVKRQPGLGSPPSEARPQ